MDGHRDAQPDVARISQRQPAHPTPFWEEREHRDRHGKGDGGVRRRPAPEHPAVQPAKPEIMAEIRADEMFRMHATGERLVAGRQQRPDERRLPDRPTRQREPRAAVDVAGNNQDERHHERHESANRSGGKHPGPQQRTAGGTEIKPVKPGADENGREHDEHRVPENHPPLETAEDIARQGGEKRLHAEKLKLTDDFSKSNKIKICFVIQNFWQTKQLIHLLVFSQTAQANGCAFER